MMQKRGEFSRKQTYGDDSSNMFLNRLDTHIAEKVFTEQDRRAMITKKKAPV